MVKMYEICEGTFVPEECCTFHEPPEGGGEPVPDDEKLPCGQGCSGLCEECVIQKVFNSYARLTGQAGSQGNQAEKAKYAPAREAMAIKVRMKGQKKIRRKVRRMRQKVEQLNEAIERNIRLQGRMLRQMAEAPGGSWMEIRRKVRWMRQEVEQLNEAIERNVLLQGRMPQQMAEGPGGIWMDAAETHQDGEGKDRE